MAQCLKDPCLETGQFLATLIELFAGEVQPILVIPSHRYVESDFFRPRRPL